VRPTPAIDQRAPAVRPRDFALVVLGAVAWGTGGVAGSELSRAADLPMLAVAAARLLGGGLLLVVVLAVAGRLGRLPRTAPVVRRVAVTAVLAALYQACYFVAVGLASVSVPTLVALGAAPVLVAAATAVRDRRPPPARTLVALVLALGGLVLLVGRPAASGAGAGALLALVSAAAFATMTVLNRTPVPGLDAVSLTGVSFTLGGLALVPVAWASAGAFAVPASPGGWALLAYLALVPTACAYSAYFAGLRTVPSTTAALLALLEPLTGAVLAAIVLHDRLGGPGLAGAILLGAAVAVLRPRP